MPILAPLSCKGKGNVGFFLANGESGVKRGRGLKPGPRPTLRFVSSPAMILPDFGKQSRGAAGL